MTRSTNDLPTTGHSVDRDVLGRTLTLSAVAANRWRIAEHVGTLLVGHGELVAVNDQFVISTPSGLGTRSTAWPALLERHILDAAA